MPPDADAVSAPPRRSRLWPIKRIFAGCFLALMLCVILLHKQALSFLVLVYAKRLASESGLILDTKISGNIFSGLDFTNTRLTANSATPAFLKQAEIEHARIQYDLTKIISGDIRHAIRAIRISEAHLSFWQLPAPTKRQGASDSSTFSNALRYALNFPGLFADNVELEGITVDVEDGSAVRSIRQLVLSAIEGKTGQFSIRRIILAEGQELGPIHSSLSYNNRRLELGPLDIDRETQLTALSFGGLDALGAKSIYCALRANEGIFSATLSEHGTLWQLELIGNKFPAGELLKRFGFKNGYATDLQALKIHAEGNPTEIQSWNGFLSLQMTAQVADSLLIMSSLEASLDGGELRISSGRAAYGKSALNFKGAIRAGALPFSTDQISGELFLDATVDDLSNWQTLFGVSLRGRTQASLDAKFHKGIMEVKSRIVGSEFTTESQSLSIRSKAFSAESTFHFELEELLFNGLRKALAACKKRSGCPQNEFGLTLSETVVHGPKFQFSADAASGDFFLSLDAFKGENLLITRGKNTIAGSIGLGFDEGESFKLSRAAANLKIKCPLIQSSSLVLSEHAFTGAIEGNVRGEYDRNGIEGEISIQGENLKWGQLGIPILRLSGTAAGGTFRLEQLYASLGADQVIQCSGETRIAAPFGYQLNADVRLSKLDSIQSALEQAGIHGTLTGQVDAAWNGSGTLTDFSGTGGWRLHAKDLQWKSLKLGQIDFEGTYSPGQLLAHTAQISVPNASLKAEVAWSKNTLQLSKISLRQKGTEVLSGAVHLPLTIDSEGTHWVKDGLIAGVLSGSKIDLSTVLPSLNGKPMLTGSLDLSFDLSGTAESPIAKVRANGRSLRTANYPNLGNCELDFDGRYEFGKVHSDFKLSGPLGVPLRVQAKVAVDLDQLLGGRMDWTVLPMELSAKITDAKLQALPKVFPNLRDIKGTGTLDARMRGSFSAPIWEGAITTDCEFVHFQTDRIPAITDLHTSVQLDGKHLHIHRARADIGGGGIRAEGTVVFEDPKNPTLRIDLKAEQVLVQRTQQLSLRLDGSLHAEGKWESAFVTGKLFAVKSMVRRDIELLPITAMQSGASGYKRPPGKPWFSLPFKPFSDWNLNIHILTQPEDPVQIRGNRLRGTAKVDVHLLGTGAAPTLQGSYISDDVVALLPFARVEVSRGRVWYSADNPFLPQTEFTAESEIRNHRIRMYLHGPPENPQISLSSDPPLAERDALTLLTAGVLPGDFASESSQAASSRAASLLVQEFSDKVLIKNDAKERFSALRRFSLDVGALNSRTGNQETRLTYRLQDNVFMIGEIGANGDFATRLRYIFRFY